MRKFRLPAALLVTAALVVGSAMPSSAATVTLTVTPTVVSKCYVPPIIGCYTQLKGWTFYGRIDQQVSSINHRTQVWNGITGELYYDASRTVYTTNESTVVWNAPESVWYTAHDAKETMQFIWYVNGIVHSIGTAKSASAYGLKG